jgi:transketolase
MVTRSLKAAEILERDEGISCRVIDIFSIKPIDKDLISGCSKETGAIVTAEEHNIIGGLGSAVAEVAAENYPVPMRRVGINDIFGESARDEEIDLLLEKFGLTATEIARAVVECRSRSKR